VLGSLATVTGVSGALVAGGTASLVLATAVFASNRALRAV